MRDRRKLAPLTLTLPAAPVSGVQRVQRHEPTLDEGADASAWLDPWLRRRRVPVQRWYTIDVVVTFTGRARCLVRGFRTPVYAVERVPYWDRPQR